MKHQVVDLVVAVDERRPVLGLCALVPEKRHHVVEMRDLAHGHVRLDVDGLRLRLGDGAEGRDLAVVEARRLAEAGEADGGRVHAVEFGEGADGVVPPAFDHPVRSSVLFASPCAAAVFGLRGSRRRGGGDGRTFLSAPRA